MARFRCSTLLLSALLAGGCSPAAPRPAALAARASASAKPAAAPPAMRQRLAQSLRRLEADRDVLASLGKELRSELDVFMTQLTPKDRVELAREGGPYARERPLLHLAAGGRSPDALYEIATSTRLAQDLVMVHQAAGKQSFDEIPPALTALAERAAARWLHDRAAEASSSGALSPELADRIDNAAQTLGRRDIVRLAREVACEIAPDDPERWISLSRARARDLDVDAARTALERAQQQTNGTRLQRGRIARAKQSLAAAELLKNERPTDAAARLRMARALLDLGRATDAKKTLEPDRAAAETSLGLASTLAEADLDGSLCPGLPAGMGNTLLCASSWKNDPRASKAVALLDKAWKNGQGRDDRSIESYLAIAQIAPWMYGTVSSGGSANLGAQFLERLRSMQAAAKQAAAASPHFSGVVLFADTIAAGYQIAVDPKARMTPDDRKQLKERARALIGANPADPLSQAAVLAVAALVFRDNDIQPLLELLPADVTPSSYLAFQVLRLWTGTTKGNAELARSASGEIASLLSEFGPDSLDRARLVLLLAEANSALRGTPEVIQVLEQVAKPLTADNVPLELRARASLDWAGARARQGKSEQGADLLQRLVGAGSISEPDVKTFGLVAASYLFVLRARSAQGAERAEYREKFVKLGEDPAFANPPSAARLWRELWKRELDLWVALDRCGALAPCLAKAHRDWTASTEKLEDEAGPEVVKLLRRGALPAGTLSLTFAFGSAGLEGIVQVSPALLGVESPTL